MFEKPYRYYVKYDGSMDGTGLRGGLGIHTYDELEDVFGEHHFGPSGDNKVDWEWDFRFYFDDDTFEDASVYNWKDGPAYCGEKGFGQERKRDWNIGGKSSRVVGCLLWAIENKDQPMRD